MASKVRVTFADFWNGFMNDCFMIEEIKAHPKVEFVSENPDLIIASVFGTGKNHLKASNPKASVLTVCWECYNRWNRIVPGSYLGADYLFLNDDIDYVPVQGKYLTEQTSAAVTMMDLDKEYPPKMELNNSLANREFCSFVFSNQSSDPGAVFRKDLFHELSKYKFVSSAGPVDNNYGKLLPKDRSSIIEYYSNYKFNICCENTSAPGYVTEKIFNPYVCRSIPIYWGHPSIKETFNPESFIFATTINDTVKQIIQLDTDPEAYMKMLSTPPFDELPLVFSRKHFSSTINGIIDSEYNVRYQNSSH